ncbi:Abi family protein, partial [Staphylococcus pseudintermedius]|nr:Abi family protein [Staphylococcus pseudintermedius]EIS6534498.1 Abi family protein [Staphylococcus pseudintermedius]EJY6934180.1 Abi family protein [Staphylococcus pseudintermedius]ELP8691822.1 Abi family protein [Staphylococcus pseudintermedius]HDV6259820.1 Abi family protein [Staphylococcus pseudintermedius]
YPKQIVRHQSQLVERYQEVDFKNLVDLASLDMRLRYIIIKFCLDIEHSIKLNIMRSITYLENEDGYKAVQRFFGYVRQTSKIKNPYKKMMEYLSYDTYRKLDYDKYEQNTPIWFLIEHIQFGNLCWFIEFYYNTYKIDEFKELSKTVRFVKNIRNKAAHNTPILNNIVLKNQINGNNKSVLITQYAKSLGIRKQTLDKRLSNYNIHDILAMLYVYDKIVVNKNMRARRIDELNAFMEYARKNKHIYDERFKSVYNFFSEALANY